MTIRQRDPRRTDRAYLAWIRKLPCLHCAATGRAVFGCEAAHVKMGIAAHGWREHGWGERSHDDHALPLCPASHRTGPDAQHVVGERRFWDRLGICPACVCEALRAAYDAGESGIPVIWDAVHRRRRDGEPVH